MTTNGNDLIYADNNSKRIDGRGGHDTVSYSRVAGNVALDVTDSGNYVYKANGTVDTLVNVEAVAGTARLSDVIIGLGSSRGFEVDLGVGHVKRSGGPTLVATGFENVIGTHKTDWIRGTDGSNWFNGTSGGDVLTGRGGSDTFSYDTWTDSYVTNNQARWSDGGTIDVITDFQSGIDKIDLRCVAKVTGRPAVWVGDRSHWGMDAHAIRFAEVGLIGNRVVANLGTGHLQIDMYALGSTFPNRQNVQQGDVLL